MSRRSKKKKYQQSTVKNSPVTAKKDESYASVFYAKNGVDYKASLKGTKSTVSSMTVDSVNALFQNIESSYVQIGSNMDALRKSSGLVARTLDYIIAHPTLNHNLYVGASKVGETLTFPDIDDYVGASTYIEQYQIKTNVPYFIQQTLIYGMSFFYEISDKSGVTYLEFPIDMCRIHSLENGVYRWMLDITKIKKELIDIKGFPNEIKNAFELNASDRIGDKWVERKWFVLSDKAVAFCFNQDVIKNGGVAISDFASLLADSVKIEKSKDNIDIKDDIDTVKLIHAKIPTNKEGVPTVNAVDAAVWNKQINSNLPKGIVAIVNPMEIESINLSGSGNSKAYDTLKDAQSQVFYSTGTSPALFGTDTKSGNIIKISISKDAAYVFNRILPVFENYYNKAMSGYKNKDKNSVWKFKFLRQSYFTFKEDVDRYKDSIANGGSRTDYLASLGMSPLEIYSKLVLEQQVLDIDSLMVPKPTSYTMSGSENTSDSNAGRPNATDPSDDTDRISGES